MSRASDTEHRKLQIIHSAMDELVEKGFCALKIRDVAQRANVSAGLICHHFDTKHGLLLAMIRHAITSYDSQLSAVSNQDAAPRDRVLALVRMALTPELSNRRLSSVWLTLYYLAGSDADCHAELLRYQRMNLDVITQAIVPLFAPEVAEKKAHMIVALMDGVWLQHATRADPVDLEAAQALVAQMTEHALVS
ncbi:TetR family transcriptional regulator C-terminal domain-containing protein [Falsiruegeria mediterranea]